MKVSAVKSLTEERVREIVREELGHFELQLHKTIKDPILEKMDIFIKEFRDGHEEYNLQVGKISEHTESIEDLDTRVSTIEQKLNLHS